MYIYIQIYICGVLPHRTNAPVIRRDPSCRRIAYHCILPLSSVIPFPVHTNAARVTNFFLEEFPKYSKICPQIPQIKFQNSPKIQQIFLS